MLNYVEVPTASFPLPDDAVHFDVGADGCLYAVGVDMLWKETAPGTRSFSTISCPAFGMPEFIRVSPSGRKAAVGNYAASKIFIFNLGQTTATEINATSYDAEWFNEQFLVVSNQGTNGPSPPSDVILVDTSTSAVRTVITQIPGYSGGVTIDLDGNIYTGIGVAVPVGPDTGLIKAFLFDDWKDLLDGPGAALNFSTTGRPAANLLSAGFLTFDADWNLCVAGGGGTGATGAPDMGYAGVVSHSGICKSLYNTPPVNSDAGGAVLQRLDPTPTEPNEYWLLNANPVRREIYLKKYDAPDVSVYRPHLLRMLTRTDFQLGDNPGYYPGNRFVGMRLSMPLLLPNPATFTGPLCVRLTTSFVESHNVSSHRVSLGGHEIGRIEGGEYNQVRETIDCPIAHALAASIYAAHNPAEFVVAIDSGPGPGLADDLVLGSLELVAKPV